jgi:hypothetical protein
MPFLCVSKVPDPNLFGCRRRCQVELRQVPDHGLIQIEDAALHLLDNEGSWSAVS